MKKDTLYRGGDVSGRWGVGGELVVDHTLCSAALSVRSVVYLPPSLLLLYDNLQSMLATSLELNAARLLNVDV